MAIVVWSSTQTGGQISHCVIAQPTKPPDGIRMCVLQLRVHLVRLDYYSFVVIGIRLSSSSSAFQRRSFMMMLPPSPQIIGGHNNYPRRNNPPRQSETMPMPALAVRALWRHPAGLFAQSFLNTREDR